MTIAEIKNSLEITQVAAQLGIQIDPRTKRACCPFHDDKNPSLQFSKEKQLATCFSSNCTAGSMDVISLTEKKLNLTTHETLTWLKQLLGAAAASSGNGRAASPVAKKPEESQNPALLKKLFTTFDHAFLASKPAKDYATERHLNIKTLAIGYNTGQFHHGENKHLIPEALKAGLLLPKNNSGGHPVFGLGSLVFALRDKENQVTGLYFRAVEPRPNKFKGRHYEKHLYLKNRKGLYPSYPSGKTQKLILTESIIDAATLLSLNNGELIMNNGAVLACYGTNGFTQEHSKAIKELTELQEVIIWFDGDPAGREAVKKYASQLRMNNEKLIISYVDTPEGEDVNSLAVSHEKEVFTHLLKNRKPFLFSEETEEKPSNKALKPSNPSILQLNTYDLQLNTQNPNKITYTTETASYSIKGGIRKDLDSLKVTLVIESRGSTPNLKSRNKLDLYEDKQTEKVARESAEKLGLRADLVENDLSTLTDLLDEYRESILSSEENEEAKQVIVSGEIKEKCISLFEATLMS